MYVHKKARTKLCILILEVFDYLFHPIYEYSPRTQRERLCSTHGWKFESVEVSRIQNISVTLFLYVQDARTKCVSLLFHKQNIYV